MGKLPEQNNVDGIDLGESIEAKILQRKQLQAAAPESPKYALPRKKQNIDDKGADINGADNGADVNVDDIEAKIAKRKAALEADKVVKKDGIAAEMEEKMQARKKQVDQAEIRGSGV